MASATTLFGSNREGDPSARGYAASGDQGSGQGSEQGGSPIDDRGPDPLRGIYGERDQFTALAFSEHGYPPPWEIPPCENTPLRKYPPQFPSRARRKHPLYWSGNPPRVFQDPGESSRLAHFTSYLAYFGPGPIARRRPLISRTLARMASRKFTLS